MARLGPFGTAPKLAVGVSGGPDSMALATLARDWVSAQNGAILALIVDHGLRTESKAEAALTAARLAALGIESQMITLSGLGGPALQERARDARLAALASAARAAGCLFLALGHHAGDQAETVAMRALRGPGGAEGMAAWTARHDVVIIRPLLDVSKAALLAFLRAEQIDWVEDPSNRDRRFERARLRLDGAAGTADPARRLVRDDEAAAFLARHVAWRPEGFAVVNANAASAPALAALLRVIGGRVYAPASDRVAALAAAMRPATLGGVRVTKAGRFGDGWLLAREPAGCAAPVPAEAGVVWDGRFRLRNAAPAGIFGALGDDFALAGDELPALVRRALPCLRDKTGAITYPAKTWFHPPAPATGAPFLAVS
jgi:tRNA(Ile)-lysidine synthase